GEGLRCNPQDLAFLSACKVYVTCLDQAFVTILDPSAPLSERFQGEVDLSSLADADALPELSHMAHLGGRVYLSVERLDRLTSWGPVAPSYVAILDPGLDVLEDAIALEGTNPLGPLRPIPGSSELVAAMAGPWDGTGAGLEIIRTQDRTSSLVIGAVELGGIPTAFTLDSGGCGFALVTEPGSFDTGVVRFCLDGRISDCLPLGLLEASDVAVDARGRLWVTDRRILAPGVRLYDAASCAELTSEAIPTGFAPGFTNPLLLVPRTAEAAGAQ
ncbi:MAG: hypothetical protein RBU30_01320, partial [Polyangia bacterium]|nr:hypothetical protein [Polyangia bacterium]